MTEEKQDKNVQMAMLNEGAKDSSPTKSGDAKPSGFGARIIAVCATVVIALSTFLPWYIFEKTSSYDGFADTGLNLPQIPIDRQQNLSIYGGSLGQSGGYAMSFAGSPILGGSIVGISIICALIAICGIRWGALLLVAIPFMLYGAIENKIHFPNAPWTIGIGTYVCAIATIIAFVSCLLIKKQAVQRTAPSESTGI